MRNGIIIFLMLITGSRLLAQEESDWMLFRDAQTDLIGYKDIHGNVKIEPKFTALTSALVFKNIIPVMEYIENKDTGYSDWKSYYLLKNGKKIGIDSLYVWDYTLDCENEGKILFRDRKTDKVGFFDKDGKVVIPAVYNDAQPFYNGMALAMKDAEKVCWGGEEYSKENPCEHWSWVGNTVLIDTRNNILLENLNLIETSYLDFYSLKVNQTGLDSTYVSFPSKNGNTYSFIDTNKQFEKWFYKEFVSANHTNQLENKLFDSISFSGRGKWKIKNKRNKESVWSVESKNDFFSKNKNRLYKVLDQINNKTYETIISNHFSTIMISYEEHKEYFTDCGDFNTVKYPYFTVLTTDKSGQVLNSLTFIRILPEEYRLVGVD